MKIKYVSNKDPRNISFDSYIVKNHPEFLNEIKPDVLLVSGGDGALLHAIQDFNHLGIPFLGHAAGTLNFLMNRFENFEETIKGLISGKTEFQIMETNSIKVEICNEGGNCEYIGQAVNEVVVGSHIMGYHHFQLDSEDGSLNSFDIKGSGVCVSTDLGSTGYNFNLGGSVLPLGSNLWDVTGVVCNRYLNDILHIQELKIKCISPKAKMDIYIDGIKCKVKPEFNQTVILNQGSPIQLAFLDKSNFIARRIDITSRFRKG